MSSSINNISKQSSFESFSWDKVKDELAQIGRDISATVDSIDFKEWIVGDFSKPQVTPLEDFFITKLKNRFSSLGEFVFTVKGWSEGGIVIKDSEILQDYSKPGLFLLPDQSHVAFDSAAYVYRKRIDRSTLIEQFIEDDFYNGIQTYGFVQTKEFVRVEEKEVKTFYREASFPHSIFSDFERCERTLTTVVETTVGPKEEDSSSVTTLKLSEECKTFPY